MMASLIEFRNPHRVLQVGQQFLDPPLRYRVPQACLLGRRLIAIPGFLALAGLATAEAIYYLGRSNFAHLAHSFGSQNDTDRYYYADHLRSSEFTIGWALGNLAWGNFTYSYLRAHESSVRVSLGKWFTRDHGLEKMLGPAYEFSYFRAYPLENVDYVERLERLIFSLRDRAEPIPADAEEGKTLIVEIVNRAGMKDAILGFDPGAIDVVLSHAIFACAFGSRREADLGLFKAETQARIRELRVQEIPQRVTEIFNLPLEQFLQINPYNEPENVRHILGTIQTLKEEEVRGSQLLTQCLQGAIQELQRS